MSRSDRDEVRAGTRLPLRENNFIWLLAWVSRFMNFEIKDGKDHLPDEEDIYGVNDAEERDAFNALLGATPAEEHIRRRKLRMQILAVAVIIAFCAAFAIAGLRWLGW